MRVPVVDLLLDEDRVMSYSIWRGLVHKLINTRKQKILVFKIDFPINVDRDQSEKSLVHINKSLYDLRVVAACIFLMNRRNP